MASGDHQLEQSARSGTATSGYFASSLEHLLAELERIHLFIWKQVGNTRQAHKEDSQFQGLVISEQEVDELLARPAGAPRFAHAGRFSPDTQAGLKRLHSDITARKLESMRHGIRLRLAGIERLFGLTSFEIDCLLICLAPELDPRYERLYAYLQDDVTKKWPSVGLVLDLLCSSFPEKLFHRARFLPGAPLIDMKLLVVHDEPGQLPSAFIGKYLRVDERVVNYLLEPGEAGPQALPWSRRVHGKKHLDEIILPAEIKERLGAIAGRSRQSQVILYLQGRKGSGRKAAAEALSRGSGRHLLVIDAEELLGVGVVFEATVRLIIRESRLQGDLLYWDNFDALLADDKKNQRKLLLGEIRHCEALTFLAGETSWEPGAAEFEAEFARVEIPLPAFVDRVTLWHEALEQEETADDDVEVLANKFRFTGGQIKDAARTAKNLARLRHTGQPCPTIDELYEACRLHSSKKLSTLGRKIKPRHKWGDIILPDDRLMQLREICNSMKYRSLVFERWGFDRKLSLGKGLNVLFAGPSGTGKTMAAEIMAGELGLDLYKIDLSTIVSKYIGETEKNLSRIFAEAETSNAILFFDEADALFGKRSEVRDAHDRYANIEINYLLQKMEEHEGVVILATNFRKNMDDAFVRRLHFTVEFPFPGEADRKRIWEKIWPQETPQGCDLDFEFMARRFEMPGGNIRNVAMAAAFLAASDGGVVNMAHLLHGTRREYQKMGKVVRQDEFG